MRRKKPPRKKRKTKPARPKKPAGLTRPRRNSGGAAASAGINFQNRVTAWLAVRTLCESALGSVFGLQGIPTILRCETEQPVDDILVGTSASCFAFINVKHSLPLSAASNSVLRSVITQFTNQALAFRGAKGSRPWERKLDPHRDALVLAVGPTAPSSIRSHLKSVLSKVRTLLPEQVLSDAQSNKDEAHALQVVESLFRDAYAQAIGETLHNAQLREILALMRVEVLDVDPHGDAEREAKNALSGIVLADSSQTDAAWATILHVCAQLAETHGGSDRAALQRELLAVGCALNVPRRYQSDILKLRQLTATTENELSVLAKINVGNTIVRVDRAVTREIERVSAEHSILVVGEPGAGKSGALSCFAEQLKSQKSDYVILSVDRLTAASDGALRIELGLEHDIYDVLDNWPGNAPAFLIIDALDAARGGSAAQTIRNLIARLTSTATRWRIVASVRKFDLRYSDGLRDLFPAKRVPEVCEFRDREFHNISHVNVSDLSNSELLEVQSQSQELATIISRAPAELRELLRNPFNLHLLAALVSGGIALDQLTPIRTRLQLLDKYWRHRVISKDVRNDGKGDARETVLRRVCEAMAETRMLRVDAAKVVDGTNAEALTDLKSAQVLVEWQASHD